MYDGICVVHNLLHSSGISCIPLLYNYMTKRSEIGNLKMAHLILVCEARIRFMIPHENVTHLYPIDLIKIFIARLGIGTSTGYGGYCISLLHEALANCRSYESGPSKYSDALW